MVNNKMSISVFAPISIGNISVGFDSLGLAVSPVDQTLVGDIVHVDECTSEDDEDSLIVTGKFADTLPNDVKENIVWRCLQTFNAKLNLTEQTTVVVKLTLEKNVPVCSGLGSSSCSVVAAFYALNEFYKQPFTKDQMLDMMVELEAEISGSIHYDNVAPCYLGGLQLIQSGSKKVSRDIPIFDDCYWVMAYADIDVSTKKARELLPKQFDREILIQFGQNLAGFIDASYRQDKALAFDSLIDLIAEPYRTSLLPNFSEARTMMKEFGALAVGISGSGPTIFTATDNFEIANKCAKWLSKHYAHQEHGFVHICKADVKGARRI